MSDPNAEIVWDERSTTYSVEVRGSSGGWVNYLNRVDLPLDEAVTIYEFAAEYQKEVRLVQVNRRNYGVVRNDLLPHRGTEVKTSE